MNETGAPQAAARPPGLAGRVSAFALEGWRGFLVCFLALAVFYLATAAGNLGETDDVYAFAYRAENFPLDHLSDPRLMLYHIAMRLLYLGATGLGLDLSALTLMRGASALCAAAALLVFLRIAVSDLRLSPVTALAATVLLGVCYGFWRYAAEAEVYVPAILFILLVYHGLSALKAGEGSLAGLPAAAAWGVFAGLTVLFYQPSVIPLFFAFPLLLADSRRILPLGAYLALGGVTVICGYVIGYLAYWPEPLGPGGLANFLSQRSGEFIVPPLSIKTVAVSLVRAAFALGHDIASANWIFAIDPVTSLIQRAFSYNVITEEVFLAKRAGAFAYLPILTLLLLAFLALRMVFLAWPLSFAVLRQRAVLVVLLWIAVNGAIVGRLNPAGVEAWIMLLPPLALLAAVVILEPCLRKGRGRLLAGFAVVLFLHNAIGGMALVHEPEGEYDRAKGAWVIAEAQPRDLVIVAGNAGLAETLRYLSPAQVALVGLRDTPPLAEALLSGDVSRLLLRTRGRDFSNHVLRSLIREAGAAGGRVILFDDFFKPPGGQRAVILPGFAKVEALQGEVTAVYEAPGAGTTYVLPAPAR